ncbi:ComC/BlpC family leader-containing pheromone/bacteriocin [Streptococcus suis]
MDKQKHNTSFTQLSDTELQSIIGGDWWTDFIKLYSTKIKSKPVKCF